MYTGGRKPWSSRWKNKVEIVRFKCFKKKKIGMPIELLIGPLRAPRKTWCLQKDTKICSIYQSIGGENDSNTNNQWLQQKNLHQTAIKKVPKNKPVVKSNLVRYKSRNTNSIQKQFMRTTHVNRRNINITFTRSVFVLLLFHAVSSRLFLSFWYSNDSEPKVHFFLWESKSHLSPVSCSWWPPTTSTHHIPLTSVDHCWQE